MLSRGDVRHIVKVELARAECILFVRVVFVHALIGARPEGLHPHCADIHGLIGRMSEERARHPHLRPIVPSACHCHEQLVLVLYRITRGKSDLM